MHIPSVPLSLLSTSPQDSLSPSVRPRDSTCPHAHPQSLCLSCPLVHGGRLHMSTHTYPQSLVHRKGRGLFKGLHMSTHTHPQSLCPASPLVHWGRDGTDQGTPHVHTHPQPLCPSCPLIYSGRERTAQWTPHNLGEQLFCLP